MFIYIKNNLFSEGNTIKLTKKNIYAPTAHINTIKPFTKLKSPTFVHQSHNETSK